MTTDAPAATAPSRPTATSASLGPTSSRSASRTVLRPRFLPSHKAPSVHPAGGKACVKAFGLVQKAYNPNRHPASDQADQSAQGAQGDPGFVAISWDEALDLIAAKLNAARAAGVVDPSGYPRGRLLDLDCIDRPASVHQGLGR